MLITPTPNKFNLADRATEAWEQKLSDLEIESQSCGAIPSDDHPLKFRIDRAYERTHPNQQQLSFMIPEPQDIPDIQTSDERKTHA